MNREEVKELIVSVIVDPENLTEVIDKICLYIPLGKETIASDANPEERDRPSEGGEPQLKVGDYVYTNNPISDCITSGKRYKVLSLGSVVQYKIFKIEGDDGYNTWCALDNCEFGGNWIIDREETMVIEPQLEVGDYIYTNNPRVDYLTAGKRYKVLELGSSGHFKSFCIVDDAEDQICCSFSEECLLGGNWIIDKK
jgi:hypothetical protein